MRPIRIVIRILLIILLLRAIDRVRITDLLPMLEATEPERTIRDIITPIRATGIHLNLDIDLHIVRIDITKSYTIKYLNFA